MYHHRETTKINYQTVMIQRKVVSTHTHTQTDRAKENPCLSHNGPNLKHQALNKRLKCGKRKESNMS